MSRCCPAIAVEQRAPVSRLPAFGTSPRGKSAGRRLDIAIAARAPSVVALLQAVGDVLAPRTGRWDAGAVPDTLQGLSRDLFAQTEKMERLDEKLLEELLRGVIKLRRVAAGENLNQLRFLQEEAHQSGDLRASSYQDLVLQNTKLLRDLDQASRKMSLKKLE